MGKLIIGDDKPYRKAEGYNQSRVNAFVAGLGEYRKYLHIGMTPEQIEEEKNKPHFRKGLAVDCKLLTPDLWAKEFIVMPEIQKDSAVYILLDAWLKAGDTEWDTERMEIFSRDLKYKKGNESKVGLWTTNKWTSAKKPTKNNPNANEDEVKVRIEARQAKFDTKQARELFAILRSFKGKTPIYPKELKQINTAVTALKRDIPQIFGESVAQDRYFQLAYFYTYTLPNGEKVTVKILLDFVVVDHEKKRIRPGDLKTTSKSAAQDFMKSYLAYGYWRQASMYMRGIKLWAEEMGFSDYEILPFLFVVKSLELTDEPTMVWSVPAEFNRVAEFGGKFNWQEVKGWAKEIEELVAQEATGQYWETVSQVENRESGQPNDLAEYITILSPKASIEATDIDLIEVDETVDPIEFIANDF